MGAHVRDVLLARSLERGRAEALLAPYGFRDPAGADRNLQALAQDPTARHALAELLPELLRCLAVSADPDAALNHLERLSRASGNALALLSHLRDSPRAIELLALTLGASTFMAEILIRHPAWFYWLSDPEVLGRARGTEDIERDLSGALDSLHSEARQRDLLRITRRREILQIGVRDLLRLSTVPETVGALSRLAEVLIGKAYECAVAAVRDEEGLPPPPKRSEHCSPAGFTVLGMGKLGGGELNFSSDVDLLYVYDSDQGRMGRRSSAPSRTEFHRALARRLTASLGDLSDEGYVYRVDLRLRPEGRAGPLAQSLAAAEDYYRTRGATWERLALLKAWPVAGDRALGRRFLERVRPFVFDRPFEARALADVKEMKAAIDRRVAARDETLRNVKLGVGGIREVELVAQVLQARHGGKDSRLRVRDTLTALERLAAAQLLSGEEERVLRSAYVFLRDVENKLQMVADTQTHSLPASVEGVRQCALRLGYREAGGLPPGDALLRDYRSHTAATHSIFEDVFAGGRLLGS